MRTNRRLIVPVLALLALAYIISIIPNFRHAATKKSTWEALQGLSHERFVAAVQGFTHDRKAGSTHLSTAVPLNDLIAGGYLQTADVRGLEGKDVRVSLAVNEVTPSMLWISVRETDGSEIGLLGDGRIAVSPKP